MIITGPTYKLYSIIDPRIARAATNIKHRLSTTSVSKITTYYVFIYNYQLS